MSKEILTVVESVSNEKGIDAALVLEAIEVALASATKRRHMEDVDVEVSIDRTTGEYQTWRRWQVVADDDAEIPPGEDEEPFVFDPERHVRLDQAVRSHPGIALGEYIREAISASGGRIAAQTAKQVIVQKVREFERAQIVEAYQDRVGELVTGFVKRQDRGNVIVDLGGNADALVSRDDLIPREALRPGDRVRGYLQAVVPEARGPQLQVSRTSPELLKELFRIEVPEIGEGLIEIMGAARDPGRRAKIGVRSHDSRIDPVGACVGMRGSRVQAVSNELAGERVDIIPWDENPAQYVINAMSPAEVAAIVMYEEAGSMDVAVDESQLPFAIGSGGQNVRLAMQLTGWKLNVMTEAEAEEKSEAEADRLMRSFMEDLDVDEEIAGILVQEGFTAVDEVAYVPVEELQQIDEFDDELVEALRARAQDVLLTREIAREEELGGGVPDRNLVELEGMDDELAHRLAAQGVVTRDDLADLATDELVELTGMEEERAGALIMTARASWFEEEEAAAGSQGGEGGELHG